MRPDEIVVHTERCTRCQTPLIGRGRGGMPWCPACEWDLEAFDPADSPWAIARPLARWGHRRARRRDPVLRASFAPDLSGRSTSDGAVSLLALLSTVVLAGWAVSLIALVVLWWGDRWLAVWLTAPLLLLAWLCRPPWGRTPVAERRDPHNALDAVVGEVARQVGVAAPAVVALDHSPVIRFQRRGLRQRGVLTIGLPLWLALDPAARVCALAHELSHEATTDAARAWLELPARAATTRLVAVLRGAGAQSLLTPRRPSARGSLDALRTVIFAVVGVLRVVAVALHLAVATVGWEERRTREYRADVEAVRVGGTAGFVLWQDQALLVPGLLIQLWHLAPRYGEEAFALLAAEFWAGSQDALAALRQHTRRVDDIWAVEPPAADRSALARAHPVVQPSLVLADHLWRSADAELVPAYRALHRRLLGTRDRYAV